MAPARNSDPLSVTTLSSRQPAAASSPATRSTSVRQCSARGFRGDGCSFVQAKPEATSIAVYCETVPSGPERYPT